VTTSTPDFTRPLLRSTDAFDALPRLGWVQEPTPVQEMAVLAASLGLEWLGTKRDDLTQPGHGGTKARKLDFLLATPPWRDAPCWTSVGAIGSGHLVACTAAARLLGRRLEAHTFWEPLSAGVLDSLAFTASGPTDLRFHPSRLTLALTRPSVLLALQSRGIPVIPPGGTVPAGMVGLVRAGVELAAQVRAGLLPEPQRVYVSLGSGGTAVGLALGLALGGLKTTVHAVAAVERALASRGRLRSLMADLQRYLGTAGLSQAAEIEPNVVILDYAHVGAGYGKASRPSLDAVTALRGEGIDLEPIYTGKAMAALLKDAEKARREGRSIGRVLFWNTVRRAGPLPTEDHWRDKLPRTLQARLRWAEHRPQDVAHVGFSRRRFLIGSAVATGAVVLAKVTGYPDLPHWPGLALSHAEAVIVLSAAEALIPPAPPVLQAQGLAAWRPVADAVDAYVAKLPAGMRSDIHALLVIIEHGTTLGMHLRRFTNLTVAERRAFLDGLHARGGVLAQAFAGLRDLCMLGYYQQPATWVALGYPGPWVPAEPRPRRASYAALVAPPRTQPRALIPLGTTRP
jgi:D-cysteine desulfhydrase